MLNTVANANVESVYICPVSGATLSYIVLDERQLESLCVLLG